MAHHTKKRRHHSHRSVRKSHFPSRPTLRNHGFRIVRHNAPSLGVRRSVKNIHRSIHNLIPKKNNSKVNNMNAMFSKMHM